MYKDKMVSTPSKSLKYPPQVVPSGQIKDGRRNDGDGYL